MILWPPKKEAEMNDFTITEDFPKSETEFDACFSDPNACYDYLFVIKWPDGFICEKGGPLLVQRKTPLHLQPMRTPALIDGRDDNGQFEKADHILV